MTEKIQAIRQTIDAETGDVIEVAAIDWTLLPPAPNKCSVCAADHTSEEPHNASSLYYQMAFHGRQGRWPTWADAAAHCTPEVQFAWKAALTESGHEWTTPEGLEPIVGLGDRQPIGKSNGND